MRHLLGCEPTPFLARLHSPVVSLVTATIRPRQEHLSRLPEADLGRLYRTLVVFLGLAS